MPRIALLCLIAACVACTSPAPPEQDEVSRVLTGAMTRERMEKLLRQLDADARGIPGLIEFTHEGVEMVCISDVDFGRMRIVAPIVSIEELTPEQVGSILEANFHTALDARYATSQGVLYAAYIHPLGPLSEAELASAVRQVATLARTFGATYTSGELEYGGGQPL